MGAFPVCPQRTGDGPAGWLFDHDLAESPVILLDFSRGETASPERSAGECGGGRNPSG